MVFRLSSSEEVDFVLVGAGLQNALLTLALSELRPAASVVLLEGSELPFGNHTWCFHAGDVPASAEALVEPLVVRRWPAYDVRFPGLTRRIPEVYSATTSDRVRRILLERFRTAPNLELRTGVRAEKVAAHAVTLEDGSVVRGKTVVDARGPSAAPFAARAFQKFVGLDLALSKPSPCSLPVLMDATVPQTDGFRFFYVLPLSEHRALIEDTYFSDGPELDADSVCSEIEHYAVARGFEIRSVLRQEQGVLPLPLRSFGGRGEAPISAGYAGGFFHPATGYSFPVALRLALALADSDGNEGDGGFERFLVEHRTQFRFAAFLNRLLFTAFRPETRWNALARFYRLPVGVIRRFYAHDTTLSDRARIMCGRPPHGLSLPTFLEKRAFA